MAAFRRTASYRPCQLLRISSPFSQTRTMPPPPASHRLLLLQGSGGEPSLVCRFLQKRPILQPALPPDRFPLLPADDGLLERIRVLNGGSRVRLDGLAPPPPPAAETTVEVVEEESWITVKEARKPPPPAVEAAVEEERRNTVKKARKVIWASQMEAARARLKALNQSCIPYSEFKQICYDAAGTEEAGSRVARSLDKSGSVIIMGDAVFLNPQLVIKAIENVIPPSIFNQNNPRREEELRALEEKKVDIDRLAAAQVKREMWAGLGFLVVQTAGFLRLTFWELSWDVMEPICFYLTSVYFVTGCVFFLRTSKEPSFESYFRIRFAAKQRRLMRAHGFDLDRFNELKRACNCLPPLPPPTSPEVHPRCFHCH